MKTSRMRIPNAANARLMSHRRINPFRRGAALGPVISVRPVISGDVLPLGTLTLSQLPVWDGTETSSSWDWYDADGIIAGTENAATLVIPASLPSPQYHVSAKAANPEGASNVRSNTLRRGPQ